MLESSPYLPPPVKEEGRDAWASDKTGPRRMVALMNPLAEDGAIDMVSQQRLGLQ